MKIKKNLKKVKNFAKKVNKVAHALGSTDISGSVGGKVGGAIGKKLGNREAGAAVGRFIGSALGKGDYVVSSNALGRSSANLGAQVPTFGRNQESTIIEHREYIGDLISSSTPGAFKVDKFEFNPSNPNLFPWLSSISQNFEQYEPLGAIIAFKSTSSDFNATGQALGTVIIASDYDVYDATYTNKVEMENSTFAVSCKTSESMLHPIECDPKLRATRLLYNGPPSFTSDGRFHNLCNVQIATVGVSAASVTLGELWVTYRIKLHKPQLANINDLNLALTYSSCVMTSATAFWGGTITLDTKFTNSATPYISFQTASLGNPLISFDNSLVWDKCFNVTFSLTTDSLYATTNTITPQAADAQTVFVNNTNNFKISNAIASGDIYTVQCTVYIKRNMAITTNPQLRWNFVNAGQDFVGPVRVYITEVPLSSLTYKP